MGCVRNHSAMTVIVIGVLLLASVQLISGEVCDSLSVSYPGNYDHEGTYYPKSTSCACCGGKTVFYSSSTGYYVYYDTNYGSWSIGNVLCSTAGISQWHTTKDTPSGSWTDGEVMTCYADPVPDNNPADPVPDNTPTGEVCDYARVTYPGNYDHEGTYYPKSTSCACCGGKTHFYSSSTGYYVYYDTTYGSWSMGKSLCATTSISQWHTTKDTPSGSWTDGEVVTCYEHTDNSADLKSPSLLGTMTTLMLIVVCL